MAEMAQRRLRYGGPHESLRGCWSMVRRGRLAFNFWAFVECFRGLDSRDGDVFSEDMSAELAFNRLVFDPEEDC